MKKTGLVLEGGAMRCLYTAGVLDVFMENDITFDGLMGVSGGAIAGCSYVSGQIGRTLRYNKRYCRDKRFMSFYSLLTTGDIVGSKFCYHTLPDQLDPYDNESFKKSPTTFYVTCTNLETGEAEYIKIKDMIKDIDYMRASASMPYVSRTVEKGGMKLLDGGCSDSIPVRKFIEMGYEKSVVILTRPSDYRKKEEKKRLAKLCYRKYPEFVKRLEERAKDYNKTVLDIQKWEKEGKIFVIRPQKPLQIGRMSHDPEEITRAYQQGHKDGESCLTSMKLWLER